MVNAKDSPQYNISTQFDKIQRYRFRRVYPSICYLPKFYVSLIYHIQIKIISLFNYLLYQFLHY